jgi:PPOX class probable F420-dependent enzyme
VCGEPGISGATAVQSAFALAARVARLATADGKGRPHVVPICFAVVHGEIYSPLDEKPKRVAPAELRRVNDIAANPAACLVIDRYSDDWAELAWVQIRGEASLVEPGSPGHQAAVGALRARYAQYAGMALEDRPMIRLQPRRVLSWGV